ncbi:hypothetical protein NIES2109_62370 (plasmid) [Nostoc sp. HK-01]|nr:hypothetical protein NIES2109_62370 [Nostoc sp. HK-01]
MDIQIALNWLIQIVVMSFVSLLIFQFITGLFVVRGRAIAAEFASIYAMAITPQPEFTLTSAQPTATELVLTDDPWQEPQFAQLPDPWFTTDITPNPIQTQPIVLPFPTLKLLPPAAQVQPKAATKKSTAKPKSTKTSKTSKLTPAVTPRKSHKKAAA